MAGRRPKPSQLKVVAGNPGKRKINDKEPAPAHEIPSPPSHLTDWGKVAWGKLTVLLDGMGVMTIADGLALERLCDIYADILQLRDTIAVEGRTYTVQTDGGFLIKPHPAVAMLADADRRFKSYLVEFGLTPAARTKVNAHDGNKEEDPLSQFFG
ncbi:phage terminase small subunit P27 family [Salmonella enterica subsp. diarizonae]|uniref:Phage terminase small subunit P27 family n=3 Tax=Salmonella enterica TaxID=28901 RepID=A0A5U3DDG8_SALDZ|nr:phage terminase small subunit P27 family [Salmonella enterica]EAA7932414.1 phage terminase small subunit P27 family [Salmonella enterica subsp. enterica serovar Redlands]EAB9739033.1 phage terminase small subunit P27 family [Salmonella enterica subsp. diarizonae]ECG1721570.1 phage terminase small subunit P27 family [Salmonella enterica subsp. diarizonae serovar 17:z10:e,n,x,z15]ECT9716433.1 phage terminase small subunit P27 family [Salmonella enterica subsp. diarizonae str. CFSAN000553]EDT6